VSIYFEFLILKIRTKSLNVFVASSSMRPSGSSGAAGSGDVEADKTGEFSLIAGFLLFLSKPEGTSALTFLLLTEDIVMLCGVVLVVGFVEFVKIK
jgi:hypothetical protein